MPLATSAAFYVFLQLSPESAGCSQGQKCQPNTKLLARQGLEAHIVVILSFEWGSHCRDLLQGLLVVEVAEPLFRRMVGENKNLNFAVWPQLDVPILQLLSLGNFVEMMRVMKMKAVIF